MRKRTITLAFTAALVLFFVFGGFRWLLFHTLFYQIGRQEDALKSAVNAEPAARALARLCQSDQFFFLDEQPLRPAWTPPEVLKLDPSWVEISADGAHVEYGGGFHHFGYNLELNKSAGDETHNSWTLVFYSEDSRSKPLTTVTLNKIDHVEQARFISGALAEFRRRAGEPGTMNDQDVTERIAFLLKFNEVETARASIRSYAAANPRDWRDQLLAYMIDAKTDPAAAGRLDAWAGQMGDFSAWLLAAYAYGAAGDENAAERCVKSALTKPVDDPDWLSSNARYRGATFCAQLLKAQRFTTCAALGNALLSCTGSGNYLAPQITSIRDLALKASTADVPPPRFEEGEVFNPFKGIDLPRLIAASATSPSASAPAAATHPALSGRDRLLDYYDHRIAAEPTSRRDRTDKMVLLLSLKKRREALAACRAAAQALPDWWRPQLAMLVYADADTREQAESQFRKWVEANPGFIHWWYVSRYYRDHGRDGDAVAALREAVKYPLEGIDRDETWVPQAFAFDAATYAYRQKRFDLVLDVTRVWSSPRGVYSYFDNNIYAFRAAAELALGQFSAAKADADKVVEAASKQGMWAGHLSELQRAADSRNQSFVYDPGGLNSNWSLFPEPAQGSRAR